MKINEEIIEILKEFKINENEGILYLIGLNQDLLKNVTLFSSDFISRICATGIFYADATGLNWKVPLYEEQETAWEWIKTEYIPLFKNANKTRGGNQRDCLIRFKKLFSKYPDIRKQDVIEATKLYIKSTEPEYVRTSHYFIEKGIGANKASDLLEWIDRYREIQNTPQASEATLNNILQ